LLTQMKLKSINTEKECEHEGVLRGPRESTSKGKFLVVIMAIEGGYVNSWHHHPQLEVK